MNTHEFTADKVEYVAVNAEQKLGDKDVYNIRRKNDNVFIDALVVAPNLSVEVAVEKWIAKTFETFEIKTFLFNA